MKALFKINLVILILFTFACQDDTSKTPTFTPFDPISTPLAIETKTNPIKYLALGDSYTIGQSVCETCRFPEQLKSRLYGLNTSNSYKLDVIAKTGWTTSELLDAIKDQNPSNDFDLITLLIGVNNQHQGNLFSVYEKEFPELVNKSIELAKGDKSNVIVVSIPDYAFTPFGYGNKTITTEIDSYNTFAQNYCVKNDIQYIYITDITRKGLLDPTLVASDNLHPSDKAYGFFVDRLIQNAVAVLKN
jgi:acyl-CoA thioesterase-1